jgi:predicted acetylornithine/succinylornithine family transaminase
MVMADNDVVSLEQQHIVPTYRRANVVFARGEGVYVYDVAGRRYLDLLSGIGVSALGHAHPELSAALADQARTMIHCSNLYMHPLAGEVAATLAALSGLPRTFFCNSGTEAVEACLKFARRFWHTQGERRTDFVALTHSFHGRTFGSLSVTAEEKYRVPFAPLLDGVRFADTADPDALADAVTPTTAAVIAEPLQGEGGVRPLSAAFARELGDVCARTGTLLIADEIQCGLGRTGTPFFFQQLGLTPDLVAVGKALGGGVPVGAALASERVASAVSVGDHGSTYGGNPLACRAASVVLDQLTTGGLIAHAEKTGRFMRDRLLAMKDRQPLVADVRGAGLMWGIELTCDATAAVDAALAAGVLVNRTATTVIRLLPPLVITEAELEAGLQVLDQVLAALPAPAGALA